MTFGVDRTTVGHWQKAGLPYIPAARGQAAAYIVPLTLTWRLGFKAARDARLKPAPAGALDTVALGLALDRPSESRPVETVAAELEACGIAATALGARAAYWRGVLDGRRQEGATR